MDVTIQAVIHENVKGESVQFLKADPKGDVEKFIERRKEYYYEVYKVNDPYLVKVLWRTKNILMFDFGKSSVVTSRSGSKNVNEIIKEALPSTIILFTISQFLILIVALVVGLKKAQKPGGRFDRITSNFTMVMFGIPTWWIGLMFIMLFGYGLKLFPTGGQISTPPPAAGIPYLMDYLRHLSLPVITLVVIGFWGTSLMIRNIVLNTLQEDFIMTARARGVSEKNILFRHTLRTAAPPIATIVLLSLLASFSGSLIFESIFSWPGMGNLYLIATQTNDVPVLLANLAVTTGLYQAGIVILDLIYGFLDPRIKAGG
jgi:peptide/nickel transport system permease protein